MKILARYLSGIFTKNLLIATSSLTMLYLFQALLGEIIEGKYPTQQVLVYYLLDLPNIFVQMTPPAVMMATVLTLSGLTRTNELVACFSIGVGLKQIMTVIMSVVIMVSCLTLAMQDEILPPLFKKRTIYFWREMKGRSDFFLDVKQDKIWYRSKNLIYNLGHFDPSSKTILGMSVYTFDQDFNLVQVVEASKASYTPQGWRLRNGSVTVFNDEDKFPMTQRFEQKELLIAETPKDFGEIEKEVDGLEIKELLQYIKRTKDSGIDTTSYEVKLHSRFSLSFIPIVMCTLAIPFSTRRRREGGIAKDIGICLVITFFYWLFYSVGLSLGTNGALPPWLAAWLPSVIFMGLAVVLITHRRA